MVGGFIFIIYAFCIIIILCIRWVKQDARRHTGPRGPLGDDDDDIHSTITMHQSMHAQSCRRRRARMGLPPTAGLPGVCVRAWCSCSKLVFFSDRPEVVFFVWYTSRSSRSLFFIMSFSDRLEVASLITGAARVSKMRRIFPDASNFETI